MEQTDREDRIRRAIIFYAALGILLIGIIVATVAIAPLYSRLKVNAENNLVHAARISTIAVDEILARAGDLALQVTSRTQIRKRLEAYNRGEIPLTELVAFSRDKLAEAMNLATEISGITRLGADGTALIETGLSLPDQQHWPIPAQDSHAALIRGPLKINQQLYLLVGAHIFDAENRRVGTDIVVFETNSLEAVIGDYTGLGESGERILARAHGDQAVLFFPLRNESQGASAALPSGSPIAAALLQSSRGQSGVDSAVGLKNEKSIIAYAPLDGVDWGLVVKMDSDELYLAANRLILLVIVVISILVLAGTFGIVWLVRPLSNTLHSELVRRRNAEYALRQHQDHLEELVKGRTTELCNAYKEMESFSYSVSHDLRAPLRTIGSFSEILQADYGATLDGTACDYLQRIRKSVTHMNELIDSLLQLSRLSRWTVRPSHIDMHELANSVVAQLREEHPGHDVDVRVDDVPPAMGDEKLLRIMLENLVGNAMKYSSRSTSPRIEFGSRLDGQDTVYFIRDNGVGFDMESANKLFGVFQRLHSANEFEGTGIGLATVKRIIDRHGGRIWAEAEPNEGATFYFKIPRSPGLIIRDEWRSACA